jgi:hypothetical protein
MVSSRALLPLEIAFNGRQRVFTLGHFCDVCLHGLAVTVGLDGPSLLELDQWLEGQRR